MQFGIVQQFWNAVGDGDRMLVTVQFTELLRMLNFFFYMYLKFSRIKSEDISIRFHRADNPKIKEKTDDAVVWS